MTSKEFVARIKEVVLDSTIQNTLLLMQKPPGRKPSADLLALSQWFLQLSEKDKKILEKAITFTARQAVFGIFAVLDGVRQIEDVSEKGTLELRYIKDDEDTLLNDPDSEQLHDLFNDA